jgi:hypothetical protein
MSFEGVMLIAKGRCDRVRAACGTHGPCAPTVRMAQVDLNIAEISPPFDSTFTLLVALRAHGLALNLT